MGCARHTEAVYCIRYRATRDNGKELTPMTSFILWCILFVLCWPLAILALTLYPIVWLVLLPFRIFGIAVGGVLTLLRAIITLPARLLGRR